MEGSWNDSQNLDDVLFEELLSSGGAGVFVNYIKNVQRQIIKIFSEIRPTGVLENHHISLQNIGWV